MVGTNDRFTPAVTSASQAVHRGNARVRRIRTAATIVSVTTRDSATEPNSNSVLSLRVRITVGSPLPSATSIAAVAARASLTRVTATYTTATPKKVVAN